MGSATVRPEDALATMVSPGKRACCQVARTNAHITVGAIKTDDASATTVGATKTVRRSNVPRVARQTRVQVTGLAAKTSCAAV